MNDTTRYQRQIILDEIGEKGQAKISGASVLVVGAGGLGCPALLYLSAAGIGKIGIVDFDKVELSNLQRQTLYRTDQVGKNKAQTAAENLTTINPDIEIAAYNERLDTNNVEQLFKNYDLIIDGTDNFTSKYLINDAAIAMNKPFIYAAIQGFEGQVGVFNYNDGPCYRCLYPKPPKEHIPNCAENGIIGAVAGIIGTTQAMEAIKIIVENESLPPLSGQLFTIDLRTMRTANLTLPKNHDCAACSGALPTIEKGYIMIEQISTDDIHEDAHLIDVREQDEWDAGHIGGAHHIPLSFLMNNDPPELPKDKDIILYCAKGMRSQYAAEMLRDHGYSNLKNVVGGYDEWKLKHA